MPVTILRAALLIRDGQPQNRQLAQYCLASNVSPTMNDAIALPRVASEANARIVAAVTAQAPRLRAFVRRQVADLSEVEDIVQDAFVELVAAHRLMKPIEHVAAWLMRVARNRIIDRFRKQARRLSEPAFARDADSSSKPTNILEDWLAPDAAGPEANYVREVLADELAAALDELPAEQRAVFVAHELDGRSFKELAAETGVGVNTLLGRKHAAVGYLRRRLQDIRSELDN
jgi:RNA polymerase sigma factor (sigma-70 family)